LTRKGLGTYLVKEALCHVYHRGCAKVILKVDKDNTGAQKFYASLKFEKGRGLPAWLSSLLSTDKEILMIDLHKNHSWLNKPNEGYKYMGIK
ncbi:GNAT family N-acetyltransferase, partial [Planctomycetota bacterium]